MKLLRILHVSDLHFHKRFFDWVTSEIDNFDVLCLSGDLIDHPKKEGQIEWVSEWLTQCKKPTFICSGNHDIEQESMTNDELFDLDSSIDDCDPIEWDSIHSEQAEIVRQKQLNFWMNNINNSLVYSDNTIRKINGITIGSAPCNNPLLSSFRKCDVLLHHIPPENTSTSNQNGKDWGCSDLQLALKYGHIAPKYLLCGHVHEPRDTKDKINDTLILNSGMDFNIDIPNHNYISI